MAAGQHAAVVENHVVDLRDRWQMKCPNMKGRCESFILKKKLMLDTHCMLRQCLPPVPELSKVQLEVFPDGGRVLGLKDVPDSPSTTMAKII